MDDPEPNCRPEERTASHARVEANRGNAAKSTGPRSANGKARSSKNATTHGMYADDVMPIARGPFAEDPQSVANFFNHIIGDLAPRDCLEWEQAFAIAGCYLRLRRIDNFEARAIEADAHLSDTQVEAVGGDEDALWLQFQLLHEMSLRAEGESGDDKVWWENLARLLRSLRQDSPVRLPGLWDEASEPSTKAEWRRAYRSLVAHWWPEPSKMEPWLMSQRRQVLAALAKVQGRGGERAAVRSLTYTLERSTVLRSRVVNEINRGMLAYSWLQQRPSAGGGEDEASESSFCGTNPSPGGAGAAGTTLPEPASAGGIDPPPVPPRSRPSTATL